MFSAEYNAPSTPTPVISLDDVAPCDSPFLSTAARTPAHGWSEVSAARSLVLMSAAGAAPETPSATRFDRAELREIVRDAMLGEVGDFRVEVRELEAVDVAPRKRLFTDGLRRTGAASVTPSPTVVSYAV